MLNARALSNRDPALAALMGARDGSDFGTEQNSRSYAEAMFGDDYGLFGEEGIVAAHTTHATFPAHAIHTAHHAPAHHAPAHHAPTAHEALAAHAHLTNQRSIGQQRAAILDPNAGSDTKIERYSFSLSQDLVLGTATAFNSNLSGAPDTKFRPQLITINAPTPGFAYISNIKMANIVVTIGPGLEDCYNFASPGWGRTMDMQTLSPSNRATVSGNSTTFVPPGYVQGATYTLSVNFKGPSLLSGGSN